MTLDEQAKIRLECLKIAVATQSLYQRKTVVEVADEMYQWVVGDYKKPAANQPAALDRIAKSLHNIDVKTALHSITGFYGKYAFKQYSKDELIKQAVIAQQLLETIHQAMSQSNTHTPLE